MIKQGIYPFLDNEDYHHNPECRALSKGGIDRLLTSPAHFKIQGNNPPTKEMVFGSAFHTSILEPEKAKTDVMVAKRVSVDARNEAANFGIALITEDECTRIQYMAESLYESKTGSALLNRDNATFEDSIFWVDPEYGFTCKCKPDITRIALDTLIDLKTARSAHWTEFRKSIANYNYDVQAFHYLSGASLVYNHEFKHFIFLVVEKTPPYCVAFYRATEIILNNGYEKIKIAKAIYKRCLDEDIWPGYEDKIIDIDIPPWALVEREVA